MIKEQNSSAIFAAVVFMLALISPVAKAGEHESKKLNIAITDKYLMVTKLPDRIFRAEIAI